MMKCIYFMMLNSDKYIFHVIDRIIMYILCHFSKRYYLEMLCFS